MRKFSIDKAKSVDKSELTELQKRRLLVIQAKESTRLEEEKLLLIDLRKHVLTLMDNKVKEIEENLVENGVYIIDKEIGHLRVDVLEEIKELKEFWKVKGVTIALGGYKDVIHGEFSLQFQLNV